MSDSLSYDRAFTHFSEAGHPRMVDVTTKPITDRVAIAVATVQMRAATRRHIEAQKIQKGDVLAIAELAGVMGAKKTADLIPLCHPLPLTKVEVIGEFTDTMKRHEESNDGEALLLITATVKTSSQTGVEMEALAACTTAALTVYDMCKAVDREMVIRDIQLVYKSGGTSGTFDRRNAID